MLTAFASIKGSPGATSVAVAVAARWPTTPAPLLVELDPAGADLGSRFGLCDEPGLRAMVAAARYGPLTGEPEWVQRLPFGVDLVVGPCDHSAAHTVTAFAESGPAALQDLAAVRPVLLDLGRLDITSPALPFLDKADRLLVVARPRVEDARHVKAALAHLARRCPVLLVVCGDGPYPAGEIARVLDVPLAATVRHDPAGADIAAGRRHTASGWTRRPLLRAARGLALALDGAPRPAEARTPGRPDPMPVQVSA